MVLNQTERRIKMEKKKLTTKKIAILVVSALVVLIVVVGIYISFENSVVLKIYSADDMTGEKLVVGDVRVKEDASLDEKLTELTAALSEKVFKLPMVYKGIEEVFGQSIAVIDLMESDKEDAEVTWSGLYFQGSTGGLMTSVALTETILQTDYLGDWVDGVKFLYEGVKVDFEHVGLYGTEYRPTLYRLNDLEEGSELQNGLALKHKTVSESGREVTYELEGEFAANVIIYFGRDFNEVWLEILESPIRMINIEVDFTLNYEPYVENFKYYTTIDNLDVFLVSLEEEQPDVFKRMLEGERVEATMRLGSFSSWLIEGSEYRNRDEFLGFVK
jgi:hypothetical protein